MRLRSPWRRFGLVLATLSLALYALVVAPHVHAGKASPNDCPVWAAHGSAGAAVDTPDIAIAPPPEVAAVASDRMPTQTLPAAHSRRPFAARAPPVSIA